MRHLASMGLILLAGTAGAQTMPAGRYQVSVSGFGPKPQVSTYCLAEQSMERTMTPPQAMKDCTTREITPNGTGVKMNLVCGGMKMTGMAGPAGQDSYRSDMTTEIEGMPPMHIVTDVKRVGPCAPGEKPVNKN